MRILNHETDLKLDRVTIYVTKEEAMEIKDAMQGILSSKAQPHYHVYAEDYRKELIICAYDPSDLTHFDERSKRLIANDI